VLDQLQKDGKNPTKGATGVFFSLAELNGTIRELITQLNDRPVETEREMQERRAAQTEARTHEHQATAGVPARA